jgi:hypothetical protein
LSMCARTSKIKSTNTQNKFTQERKVGHRGCARLGNVVALRRKWQESLQRIQPSECTCPGVRGRQRGALRWIPHQAKSSVDEPLGGSVRTCEVRLGRERGRVLPKKAPIVRRSRTRQVSSRCLARVTGQNRIGLENLEIAGLDSCSKPKGGRRSGLRWISHQANASLGATRVSVSDRRTPMRVQVRPRANERWITHQSRRSAWARAGLAWSKCHAQSENRKIIPVPLSSCHAHHIWSQSV